jgi:hypothetical protein
MLPLLSRPGLKMAARLNPAAFTASSACGQCALFDRKKTSQNRCSHQHVTSRRKRRNFAALTASSAWTVSSASMYVKLAVA